MIEQLKRLKELGWEDVTEVERAKLQSQGAECANDLCKAFEKADTGIRYCYSEQGVDVFLEQLEAHTEVEPQLKELSETDFKRLRYCEWISEDETT